MYELGEKKEWVDLYKYKNNFLEERGFKEVDPFTFYRDLFPKGSLQEKGEHLKKNHSIKGNIIGIQIDKRKKKSKNFIITEPSANVLSATGVPIWLNSKLGIFMSPFLAILFNAPFNMIFPWL